MKTQAILVEDSQDEIAALIRTLHETQQRLQQLAGGEVDAVIHADGQSYLLHEAQGECAEEAQGAAGGIRSILASEAREFSMEYPCHSPDQQRWFQLMVNPLENGGAHGAVVMHVDITQRKQLEYQILRSQRMESIGTLAGGIAHDLNNALAPIVMSIDLLKLRFPEPGSRGLLAMIDGSAQRAADMVRQLLSFARGVEGRRMEVQMKHLVKDVEKSRTIPFSRTSRYAPSFPAICGQCLEIPHNCTRYF